MPNAYSALIDGFADAPDTQIDKSITARLRVLAAADHVVSEEILTILDDCAYAGLASTFAMQAMNALWLTMLGAEGLTQEQAIAAAEPRRQILRGKPHPAPEPKPRTPARAERLEAALYGPGVVEADKVGSKALIVMMEALYDLFDARKFSTVDRILESLRPADLADIMALGLLRYSFAVRELLPHWPSAVRAVHAEFVRRGRDADRELHGLLDPL